MIEMKDNLDQLLCVEYRTRTSEPTRVSETVLMTAVARNRPSMLTLLLKGKADPDKQNDEGKTALMIAVKYGFAHLVTILVNYLAKLMIVDKQGYNAITLAVKSNNYEVIDALTAKRPNLNVLDAVRGAPLHYA
jgi:ankyrin repeat protein